MSESEALLIALMAASWWMAAVTWMVQLLVYPTFAAIDAERWIAHHERHGALMTPLVFPPMLVQLLVPVALLAGGPDTGVGRPLALLLLALAGACWVITITVSVPCHRRLGKAFSDATLRRLVRTHWLRTIAWTALAVCSTIAFVGARGPIS
jgi:hypothetical protein